jgi:hypothetical protein
MEANRVKPIGTFEDVRSSLSHQLTRLSRRVVMGLGRGHFQMNGK